MEKLERYLRFIREAERLKDVLRTAHTSTGRHESTAEHSWRLALLAAVLTGERPRLDMQRVLLMCLVHDLGEAYDGDIPAVAQMADGTKEASELVAIDKLTDAHAPARGRDGDPEDMGGIRSMPDARGAVGESPRQGRDHHPA